MATFVFHSSILRFFKLIGLSGVSSVKKTSTRDNKSDAARKIENFFINF